MKCTHVALQVKDVERSIAFYGRYCGLRVIHDRTDDFRVVWLGWGEQPPRFALVLLETPYAANEPPAYQHLGLATESRAEVDAVAERALAAGLDVPWPPRDGGPVVGYFCGLRDPDGNMVEFSHGQPLG
jgi:catechol 2,3-dioxygenase-like lactoylglutathione lyase family enzyme